MKIQKIEEIDVKINSNNYEELRKKRAKVLYDEFLMSEGDQVSLFLDEITMLWEEIRSLCERLDNAQTCYTDEMIKHENGKYHFSEVRTTTLADLNEMIDASPNRPNEE